MLSEHFDRTEFGDVPDECLPTLTFFCQNILEPIRSYVVRPLIITSGYRSPEENAAAHGVTDSEHIYTPEHCAADFTFDTAIGSMLSKRIVFDWIRTNPYLPYHQVILEFGNGGTSIIHISFNKTTMYARSALEGRTNNASPYMRFDTVPYELPNATENA